MVIKTKEELDALKEEVETLNKKLHELTEEELEQVFGGRSMPLDIRFKFYNDPPLYKNLTSEISLGRAMDTNPALPFL